MDIKYKAVAHTTTAGKTEVREKLFSSKDDFENNFREFRDECEFNVVGSYGSAVIEVFEGDTMIRRCVLMSNYQWDDFDVPQQ
ncbi:MAG: hypothetical protein OYG31_01660 [Candidatus Kaiserbacteria bacterium]|nr:hypothetical protein [Candidatus Kaiserbacteria bacterium]